MKLEDFRTQHFVYEYDIYIKYIIFEDFIPVEDFTVLTATSGPPVRCGAVRCGAT